jgi:hypothetical protein
MAKTKAELEADCSEHYSAMCAVRAAHQSGEVSKAIELAVAAWQHIDGMMQFERRYGEKSEYESIDSIDYVLQYAPLTFDFQSLDWLSILLKRHRRIEKNTTADLAARLNAAQTMMWSAYRLWNYLERQADVRQDELCEALGGDRNEWQLLIESWEWMGLIGRIPDGETWQLRLLSSLNAQRRAKCPGCGAIVEATFIRCLDEITCPRCHATVHFVLQDWLKVRG